MVPLDLHSVTRRAAEDEAFALRAANRLAAASLFEAAVAVLNVHLAASPRSVTSLLTLAQIESHVGRRDASLDALLAARVPTHA